MENLLVRKLEGFGPLPDEDKRLLDQAIEKVRAVGARTDIIREGESPEQTHLVLEGFACRYKLLPDGTRQIMAYLVPGDFCDLHVFILREMDHSIAAVSPCKVVEIPRDTILSLSERPAIARAFWWAALVDEAVLREWLVNMGRRPAEERLAHLFCEFLMRLRAVGLADGGRYELPMTQADLGDTLGLSTVHVNRVLQALRAKGLVELKSRTLVLLDPGRLMEFAGFNPNYLHLERRERAVPNRLVAV